MAKQIILNADLYPNPITERTDDYTAKPRITGTVRNLQIAERILQRGSEFRLETIEHILNMADQEKVTAIAEGNSVIDGVGQYLVNIMGSFIGEKATFDPTEHKLGVSYTIGKLLREALKDVSVVTGTASTGPFINSVTDSSTGDVNGLLTSASAAVIKGSNIRIIGDDAAIGVFLTKTGSDAPLKAPLLIHNNPSELTIMLPAMEDGEYTLSITTQYASGNRQVKAPRTYTFPTLLYVGEKPSSGGGEDDRPGEL